MSEKKELEEALLSLIKSAQWNVDYHTEALKVATAKLQVLINSKVIQDEKLQNPN